MGMKLMVECLKCKKLDGIESGHDDELSYGVPRPADFDRLIEDLKRWAGWVAFDAFALVWPTPYGPTGPVRPLGPVGIGESRSGESAMICPGCAKEILPEAILKIGAAQHERLIRRVRAQKTQAEQLERDAAHFKMGA